MCSSAEQNEIKQKGAFFAVCRTFLSRAGESTTEEERTQQSAKKATPKTEAATK